MTETTTADQAPQAPDPLANRVRKNERHWRKWARQQGLEAYRLYDRDMPERPYIIDRYGDWLHVQLLEQRRPLSEGEVTAQLDDLARALAMPPERIVLKTRRRQRGSAQYEKTGEQGEAFLVRERDLQFEVNLQRYLDTGLFIDHRDTRQLVRERVAGRAFLNLFAYTGSFTVYAAAGGARSTLTVDMSQTYQHWTRRNLLHNGIDDFKRHRLVCSDVFAWLEQAADEGASFDLIVLDPPSFSNSKRMRESFDIQRDQRILLPATLALLAPGGELYFSTNRRGFRLDPALAEPRHAPPPAELTPGTLPADCRRHPPHRCWRFTRPG